MSFEFEKRIYISLKQSFRERDGCFICRQRVLGYRIPALSVGREHEGTDIIGQEAA